ncbi:MAG: histidine--tRNA ligase [Acholeplasmatales bacterium]|jgi:histidyl-tRNA synthetase|nr:histidine--tRNA ligase [Acholeplasmatales bacterium]
MYQKVKGTYDVLPNESPYWQFLEQKIREICAIYNFSEVRTPILEHYEVIHRVNEDSDMVKKQTYDFKDLSDRLLTLRPEQTAGIIRAYVENKLYANQDISKFYYIGPNFRYERPQKGRFRQFSQFGVEALNSDSYLLDAEIVALAYNFIKSLGINEIKVEINSIGDSQNRIEFRKTLVEYFTSYTELLCDDCKNRLLTNPLRILDCKVCSKEPFFKNAPSPLNYLNNESKERFDKVLEELENANIDYVVNPNLVRGLDYYDHTVFEIVSYSEELSHLALGGGGRYSSLVKELGGPDITGIGFAFGMERLLLALNNSNLINIVPPLLDVYLLVTTNYPYKISLLQDLRKNNITVETNYTVGSFKNMFIKALNKNPKYILIAGEDEFKNNTITVKNLSTRTEEIVKKTNIIKYLKKELKTKKG